uniref:Copia protein n=1 Tax=Lygus hesperus TaxID=30085 RepID=A0A0A9Z0Y1_LYGHE
MAVSTQLVNIKLFDGSGFENWCFRVERLLEKNDCLDVLTSVKSDASKPEDWEKEDAKARYLIVQCVSDNVLDFIKTKKTAKEMIDSLKATYVQKSMSTRVQLQKQLRMMSFTGQSSMSEYLVEFDKVVLGIFDAGGKMDDNEYVSQLLSSLPDTYNAVVTSIDVLLSVSPEKVTKDFVKNKLLSEYS